MAVDVRRHLDGGVPEPRLHHLERQFEAAVDAAVDAPRRVEVPQAVQAGVLRLAAAVTTPAAICAGMQAAVDDVGEVLDVAGAVREDEIKLALRAGEPLLPQRVHHHRRQRHGALAGFRLGRADGVKTIGALADVQIAALEIDILPAQAAQFGRAQAGEDRRQQQRPPAAFEVA